MGDEVEVVGYQRNRLRTTIIGVEIFKKQLDYAQSGDNCGLLLRGILKEDVRRGMYVTKPGLCNAVRNLRGEVYILKEEERGRRQPILNKYKPQCFIRTADFSVSITLPEAVKMVTPGDSTKFTMKTEFPMAIKVGERFALREGSKTIAAGVGTEILPDTNEDLKEEEERAAKKKKK